MVDLFKELIPAVLSTKANVIDSTNEKEYVPFMVNRALSYHIDCIMAANVMNMNHGIDNLLQFQFLLNTVRSKKRPFQKWQKLEKVEDLDVVSEYYNLSPSKAKAALGLLSNEQIAELKTRLYKGGLNGKSKRINRGEA